MEEVLKAARKAVDLAKSALRKGWTEMALMRYGQAIGMLQAYLILCQTQEVDSTEEGDLALIRVINSLEKEAKFIVEDWGNGHRNPPRHEIADVGRAILKDLREIREVLK